jgi:diguanylate cyclase (GGDEF)-like protein/PAS domain S-box-containing protein
MDGAAIQHVRRRRGSQWAIVAVVMTGAVVVMLGVGLLNRHADDSRRSQMALARIEGLSHQLIALEWHAEAHHDVTPQIINDVENIRQHMLDALVDLRRLDQDGATSREVISALRLYETNITQLYQLFAAKNVEQAIAWNEQRVHPSYHALLTTIAKASQSYAAQAQRSNRIANISSSVTMAAAALLVGMVFWHFEQMRSTTQLLAIEQHALRQSEERFRALVRNASDVIVISEPDGTIRYCSPAVERRWGRHPDQLRGSHVVELVHPEDRACARHVLVQTLNQPGNISTELRIRHGDGSWRHFESITSNLLADPSIKGIVTTYHDITERKKFEAQLTQLAFHDPLSKLPNRALFIARLEHALARLERTNDWVGVLFLDLDNFKVINDSLGHHVGDRLLVAVAERLQHSLRPTDTIARLGGDEFTILLEDISDLSQAIHVAERIQEQLQQPFVIDQHEIFSGASIGITISSSHLAQPSDLLRDADLAMYRAKSNGK